MGRKSLLNIQFSASAFSKGDTHESLVGGNLRPEADAWLENQIHSTLIPLVYAKPVVVRQSNRESVKIRA